MWNTKADENVAEYATENAEGLYLAGERVLPGTYRQIGGGREISLETEDTLPASLDGRVACYMRIHNTWAQLSRQHILHAS